MKIVSRRSVFAAAVFLLALCTPGVSHAAKTHLTKVARMATPPPGKALVNIHRMLGGSIRNPIFDENGDFLMDLPGNSECQLVCEPGQKTVITWFGANPINVVTLDLAPDKTYDLVMYADFWKGLRFIPRSKAPGKLRDFAKLEKRERDRVYQLERDDVALHYEAAQKAHLEQIKTDFLGGTKSSRVIQVSKDDCR